MEPLSAPRLELNTFCRRAEELETLREELRAQRAIALEGEAASDEAAAAAARADTAAAEAAHERAALAAHLAARERCGSSDATGNVGVGAISHSQSEWAVVGAP